MGMKSQLNIKLNYFECGKQLDQSGKTKTRGRLSKGDIGYLDIQVVSKARSDATCTL